MSNYEAVSRPNSLVSKLEGGVLVRDLEWVGSGPAGVSVRFKLRPTIEMAENPVRDELYRLNNGSLYQLVQFQKGGEWSTCVRDPAGLAELEVSGRVGDLAKVDGCSVAVELLTATGMMVQQAEIGRFGRLNLPGSGGDLTVEIRLREILMVRGSKRAGSLLVPLEAMGGFGVRTTFSRR